MTFDMKNEKNEGNEKNEKIRNQIWKLQSRGL
jgi:hypothetical protein